MRKTKRVLICFLVLLFALSAAGCSNDKEGTQQDNSLQRIQDAGEISLAMSGGYPPFNYYDENNKLVGFDVDVCKEVAKRLGVEFKPVTTEWSGIIPGLTSGVYDGILGSMAITEDRLKVVDFSVPYYYSGAQVLVREDSDFAALEDLKGKTVGLATGTTFEGDAEKLGVEVKLYKDDNLTLMELKNSGIDGVITDRVVGVNAINKGDFNFKLLGSPLRSEDIAVAFRQEDDQLREAVDEILNEMHEDGTLTAISEQWLNVDITGK